MNVIKILFPFLLINLAPFFCSSQPYRLASIPKRQTAEFFGVQWTSLGDGLRFMGSQNQLAVTDDTTNINSFFPKVEGVKDFDSLLYVSQYESSYGMRFTVYVDTGTYQLAFHFLNFPMEDTTRERHIDIYKIDNNVRTKSLDINLTSKGFNRHFTYEVTPLRIDSARYLSFELINDFSKSVKDNYVTLTAFEMVHVDSLFCFYEPFNVPVAIESKIISYPTNKIKPVLNELQIKNNELDSLINVLQAIEPDTIYQTEKVN